jgi:hypothetical protein
MRGRKLHGFMQGFRRRTMTHLEVGKEIFGHCHFSVAAQTLKLNFLRYTKSILKEIKRKKRKKEKN